MPQYRITLTANAGVAVQSREIRFWSDAVHSSHVPGFSSVTPALWRDIQLSGFCARPDLILFTHRHPDHYSRELTEEALRLWPYAELAAPFQDFPDQFLLDERRRKLSMHGVSFRFAPLIHEAGPGGQPPNYGCLADFGGCRLLIPGDCAVAEPALAAFAGEKPVDILLLDFPWITLKKGREFIRRYLRPAHLLVYHLPFAQDDEFHYRPAAEQAAGLLDFVPDVRLLKEPLQSELVEA